MEDRELLELAARAAGIALHSREIDGSPLLLLGNGVAGRVWNPLQDDGDALRLAVALRLTVAVRYNECEVFEDGGECLVSVPIFTASAFVKPEQATDPAEATRRAIVRAAAALATAPAA